MKVLILGFDGLNWLTAKTLSTTRPELRILFQDSWGIYDVESDKYSSIYLWSSFLTGIPPQKLGKMVFVERRPLPPWTRKLPKLVKRIGRRILKPYKPTTIKGVHETIFDSASKPLAYNVLTYNEEQSQLELRLRYRLTETIGDREKCLEAYREWLKWSQRQAREFLDKITSRDWDLAMTHFWIIDIANHLLGEMKVHETYRFAAEFLNRVKQVFDEDAAILAVSDHGTYRGLHTPEAFYSLNREIDPKLKPTRIWHFKKLITKLLEAE